MKNFLLLIVFLSFSFGKAQQSELLETTWYLTEVIHQNTNYPFIPDNEVSSVPLNFSLNPDSGNNQLNIQYCTGGYGEVLFEEESKNYSFRLINTVFLTWMCQEESNIDEENRYLGIFDTPYSTAEYYYGDFTYEIYGESENRTLVITNESENQAIYGSQNTASVLNTEKFGLTIYPNPITDILNFNLPDNFSDFKVKIFDINGKLLLETSNNNSVNVSALQNGLYFVFLENSNNFQTFTRKFIKK